jgi:hypothetical protein
MRLASGLCQIGPPGHDSALCICMVDVHMHAWRLIREYYGNEKCIFTFIFLQLLFSFISVGIVYVKGAEVTSWFMKKIWKHTHQ